MQTYDRWNVCFLKSLRGTIEVIGAEAHKD